VACLYCGKEFAYDWHEMKVLTSMPKEFNGVAAAATAESYGKSA
jgi:hypothetical protein